MTACVVPLLGLHEPTVFMMTSLLKFKCIKRMSDFILQYNIANVEVNSLEITIAGNISARNITAACSLFNAVERTQRPDAIEEFI
jgi:hypothetical protein